MQNTSATYQNNSFGAYLTSKNTVSNARTNYIYSFQGQEHDDEIKGKGNSVNYTFRMHDPRLGRFFAVDPLAPKYPFYSPYAFSGNRVIDAVELEGLEPSILNTAENIADPFLGVKGERHHTYDNGHTVHTVDGGKYWVSYFNLGYQNIEDNQFNWHAADPNDPLYEKGWVRFTPQTEQQRKAAIAKNWAYFSDKSSQIVAGTLTVIGTAGLGVKAGFATAIINGGVNYLGQLMANDWQHNKVDLLDVGFATASGFIVKNPMANAVGTAGASSLFDYSKKDGFSTLGIGKEIEQVGNDFLWNSAGNLGGASFGKVPFLFQTVGTSVTTIPTTIINEVIDNQIAPTSSESSTRSKF